MKATTRRDFVRSAGVFGFAGVVAPQGIGSVAEAEPGANPDLVVGEEEGEVYLIGPRQGRVVIKIDKRGKGVGAMSMLTEDIVAGDGIPVHKHLNEEELIYIQRGNGVMAFGDEELAVAAGSVALIPRGVWHGLRNAGEETLRMVFGYTPAGFEDYFRAIGVKPGEPAAALTEADWARINERFGIVYRR